MAAVRRKAKAKTKQCEVCGYGPRSEDEAVCPRCGHRLREPDEEVASEDAGAVS